MIDTLQKELDALGSAVSQLLSDLHPVLRQSNPGVAVEDVEDREARSPLIEQLIEMHETIMRITTTVNDAITRVDVPGRAINEKPADKYSKHGVCRDR